MHCGGGANIRKTWPELTSFDAWMEHNVCLHDRYIGPVQGLPSGRWLGVEFAKKQGKNDGSVNGSGLSCAWGCTHSTLTTGVVIMW